MRRMRRRRPSRKLPWRYDWRNPEMVVCPRVRVEVGPNIWEFQNHERTPEEMNSIAQDSLAVSEAPVWHKDKSYY